MVVSTRASRRRSNGAQGSIDVHKCWDNIPQHSFNPQSVVILEEFKACMFTEGFLTKKKMITDVSNRPYKSVECNTPTQNASWGEIYVEPVSKKLWNRTMSHKKNIPEGSHLIPNCLSPLTVNKEMINLFYHIPTNRAVSELRRLSLASLSLTRCLPHRSGHIHVLILDDTSTAHTAF